MFQSWTDPNPLRAAALDAANRVAAMENGVTVTNSSQWVVIAFVPDPGSRLGLDSARRGLDDEFQLKCQCLGGMP